MARNHPNNKTPERVAGRLRRFSSRGRSDNMQERENKIRRMISASSWSTTKAQLGNCRTFCHSACRLFIVVPFDCWGMRLTQRMPCRKRFWPLTNI